MKKLLSCLLAVLILVSFCAMAFAEEEVVPSVEAEPTVPEVSSAVDASGADVGPAIVITPYEDKDTLSEEAGAQMDMAFEALQDLDALVEANEDLKALADEGEFDTESLFDISIVGEVELPVDLQLKLANADNFAALLYFVDGVPEVVEAGVEDDVLAFSFEKVGTYAILSFVEAE